MGFHTLILSASPELILIPSVSIEPSRTTPFHLGNFHTTKIIISSLKLYSTGIPFVTLCYVLVNIAYLTVMTSAEIGDSTAVAVSLADQLYGVMAWTIPLLVACSTFGAANGCAFTSGTSAGILFLSCEIIK